MIDFIIIGIIAVIIALAAGYIIRAKKKGVRCIGCPSGSTCCGKCSSDHSE